MKYIIDIIAFFLGFKVCDFLWKAALRLLKPRLFKGMALFLCISLATASVEASGHPPHTFPLQEAPQASQTFKKPSCDDVVKACQDVVKAEDEANEHLKQQIQGLKQALSYETERPSRFHYFLLGGAAATVLFLLLGRVK